MPTDDFKGLREALARSIAWLERGELTSGPMVGVKDYQSMLALLAELDRVREDAARLDHLESMIQLGKIEIARSLLGTGYEFGHWVITKGPTAKVHSGSLRAAIDAARSKGKEGGS